MIREEIRTFIGGRVGCAHQKTRQLPKFGNTKLGTLRSCNAQEYVRLLVASLSKGRDWMDGHFRLFTVQ